MKSYNEKAPDNLKFLKRKKRETFHLDIYINSINQIKIEKIKSISKLTIIEENKVIITYKNDK